tara:strand:- start:160 stop:285 length:126 start_codon:yes stop_codon:yes gene_type:complete
MFVQMELRTEVFNSDDVYANAVADVLDSGAAGDAVLANVRM